MVSGTTTLCTTCCVSLTYPLFYLFIIVHLKNPQMILFEVLCMVIVFADTMYFIIYIADILIYSTDACVEVI